MKTVTLPTPVEMPMSYHSFIESLEDKGWVQISQATYSRAFIHPKKPGRVLKVSRDDEAYDGFLSVVLAYPGNPFFPKIYNVKRYHLTHEPSADVTVVEMERLSKWHTKYNAQWKRIERWREDMEIYGESNHTPSERFWWDVDGDIHYVKRGWRNRWEMQAAAILAYLFTQYRGDLHSGNVMLRGRHPVITDPVF